jgi:phospholipid/cholesterol/gamma-HCH transport system substrate-binding protein
MSVTRSQRIRLAVFIIVSGSILVLTIALLVGLSFLRHRDTYFVRYRFSVSGLEVGTVVKYQGVRVGNISEIRIDPENIEEVVGTLSLDPGTPVKEDTLARISTIGITGLKFVELIGGTKTAKLLKPGMEIKAGESIVDKLTGKAEVISQQIEILTNSMNEILNSENREKFSKILTSVDKTMQEFSVFMTDSRENLTLMVENLTRSSESLSAGLLKFEDMMDNLHVATKGIPAALSPQKTEGIINNISDIIASIKKRLGEKELKDTIEAITLAAQKIGKLAENADATIRSSKENLQSSFSYLLEGLENLSEFSRMLREDPSVILKGSQLEDRKIK